MKWFKEEEEIDTTIIDSYEVIDLDETVTLVIKSVRPSDSGPYSARVTNEAGTVLSNKAILSVKCNKFKQINSN